MEIAFARGGAREAPSLLDAGGGVAQRLDDAGPGDDGGVRVLAIDAHPRRADRLLETVASAQLGEAQLEGRLAIAEHRERDRALRVDRDPVALVSGGEARPVGAKREADSGDHRARVERGPRTRWHGGRPVSPALAGAGAQQQECQPDVQATPFRPPPRISRALPSDARGMIPCGGAPRR